jgi:ethanolamine utilization protein EutA
LDRENINSDELKTIVHREYASAKINPEDVETGAVIITGETAKKKNADVILQALSGLAGDFVVSVAGPNVESLISGRGSGAAIYSREHYTKITNLDIGGGSANSATFKSGTVLSSAAMNLGGRLIEIDHSNGRIRYITEPALNVMVDCGLNFKTGAIPSLADLRRFTDRLADMTIELVEGTSSPLAQKLYLTPPAPISGKGSMLMFSGGVGYYFYHPIQIDQLSDLTIHDDIGPLLANSLREHSVLSNYEICSPGETLRATVLGASTQTVTLSGSTIWAERQILPMRNLPVIHPVFSARYGPEDMAASIRGAIRQWDLDPENDQFALALDLKIKLDYEKLLQLASGIKIFAEDLPFDKPLVFVIERDYAQALGQTVKGLIPARSLLVIDQVGFLEGDYIDIGLPLMDGRVVPLSVKTLVFYH